MTNEHYHIRRNPLQQQSDRNILDIYAKPQIVRGPKSTLEQSALGR